MPRGAKKLDDGPEISLSGYQPGKEFSGLYLVAPKMHDAFLEKLRTGDSSGEGLRVVVVGVVEVFDANIARPGVDKHPTLNAKFVRIEPVIPREGIDGDPVDDVVNLMLRLHDIRVGENPELETPDGDRPFTDSPGEGDDSQAGTATNGRAAKRAARNLSVAPAPQVFVEP